VYHPTSPALSTVSIVQSRAVTGDITTRKNIEQIRSDIKDDRILGIRLEIGYNEYKRPVIRSLLYQGNLFPELITMPPPVLNHEG
jgi:chromosome condensin MukBEF MukE localization factor